jgi:DNA-binding SARP family transcriptional activator
MQQLVIRLLGPPEIRYANQLVKIPRRGSRALLYYMVCTHTPQPRERLLDLLCGEMDEESARHSFKTLLAEVRFQLRNLDSSIEWITGDGDTLALNPLAPLWLDAEVFETSAASVSRNLTQAVDLYRGKFLDGFFLKDSPGFEEWILSTRDHFHHIYFTVLRRLTALYEEEGQVEQALSCAQRLVQADPLSEDACAKLMRIYWRVGDRVEALRQYEKLCTLLADELAVKPMAATRALYEEILHDDDRPSSQHARRTSEDQSLLPRQSLMPTPATLIASSILPPVQRQAVNPPTSPFVGHTQELALLRCYFHAASDKRTLLLVRGAAGVGKTRLIDEALQQHCSTWAVLRGTCQQTDRCHPYEALIDALRDGISPEDMAGIALPAIWQSALASLLPELYPAGIALNTANKLGPTLLAQAFSALLNEYARSDRPVVLALDDLHHAHKLTLALLGYVSTHVQPGNVFLIGAFDCAISAKRLALLRDGARQQNLLVDIALERLSPQEIEALTACFMEKQTEQIEIDLSLLNSWCYYHSEGNPYYALEWLRLALREYPTSLALPDGCIPQAVRQFIENRLDQLGHAAFSLLEAAAYLGRSFTLPAAVQLAGLGKHKTREALQELTRSAYIKPGEDEDDPECYMFVSRVVRDVVLEQSSAFQRHQYT